DGVRLRDGLDADARRCLADGARLLDVAILGSLRGGQVMSDATMVDAVSAPVSQPGFKPKHLLAHAAIIGLGLVMLYPVVWMVSSSFKPSQLIFSEPGLWPRQITLENWGQGWVGLGIPFGYFFVNSFVIAVLSVVGNLCSCSIAAYSFARLE